MYYNYTYTNSLINQKFLKAKILAIKNFSSPVVLNLN